MMTKRFHDYRITEDQIIIERPGWKLCGLTTRTEFINGLIDLRTNYDKYRQKKNVETTYYYLQHSQYYLKADH